MRKIRYKELSKSLDDMVAPVPSAKRASVGMEKYVGEFFYLPIEKLRPYRKQVRRYFDQDEIDQLASTIQEYGILQPLLVIQTEDGFYEILSGERRYRAAKLIGLERLPCRINAHGDKDEEKALIENIQRTDLNPLEVAQGIQSLIRLKDCTQEEIAKHIGLPRSTVVELLKLTKLSQDVQEALVVNGINQRDTLRKISSFDNKSDQLAYISSLISSTESKKKDSTKERSILRVSLCDGLFRITSRGVKTLSQEEKGTLKEELSELIRKI